MKTEKELFLEWHYKQFEQLSCDGLNDEDSKNLYERVYSHNHQDLIRKMEFNAWLSSASREGYKLVPVQPELETMQNMSQALRDNTRETPKRKMQEVYKAAIGAVE